ncbi:hypothetical protein CCR75_009218 [Bremia lactucae]|uniref:Uncharacterized protein n=1 Tax=Bremia lactucae TaxID=4779 RepID=A0A976FPQ1_BRELC|nr:hypothetical protein CCR75_009218 [Bremia lactucae]
MQAPYILELHALKAELQNTLARLGVEPLSADETYYNQSFKGASEVVFSRSKRHPTRWNRRQLTQEVAAASQRRRELEQQLQAEIQRHKDNARQQNLSSVETPWQTSINDFQQQEIETTTRQIEEDATAIYNAEDQGAEPRQRSADPSCFVANRDTNQYSIGGVVTLEPLALSQQAQVPTFTTSRVSFRSVAPPAPKSVPMSTAIPTSSSMDTYARLPHSPDALNDVYSLQLKFAETMLKLEKSVQMRNHLLHHRASSRKAKSGNKVPLRQKQRHHRQIQAQSDSNSASSVSMYRESCDSESSSSSASSISSLDLTKHQNQSRRLSISKVSKATLAETLAPSSSDGAGSPGISTTERAVNTLSTAVTRASYHDPHTTNETAVVDSIRTPLASITVTTPTTESDEVSNTSSLKQVRFGKSAFSTPVVARRINFDEPSIEEDEEEEKEQESELSFLGGSSVNSDELNNSSITRAFERFRRALNVSRLSSTESPMQAPLARDLCSVDVTSSTFVNDVPCADDGYDNELTLTYSKLDDLSLNALQELRRRLCLDIQAESAQYVLSYSELNNATNTDSLNAEQAKNRLSTLRQKLNAVDASFKRKKT